MPHPADTTDQTSPDPSSADETLLRDTAVTGAPDPDGDQASNDGVSAPEPAEGSPDVPPPGEGSPDKESDHDAL